jgi:hypothetical protein
MRLAALLTAAVLAAAPAAAQPRDPSFELVNQSGRTVWQVFASPVTQREWGRDHLGATTLREGQTTRVRLAATGGCLNDIRIVFTGGASVERRNVDTCAEQRLLVTAQAIIAQQGAAPGAPPGGEKTAGGLGPAPGARPPGPATAPPPGARPPAPVATPTPARPAPPVAAAPRGNPSFWIVNASRRTMRELYASPSSQQTWGPDRFGTGVLGGGDRFAVRLPEGECIYDVRVVWADGRPEDRRRVNLCDVIELTYE